MLLESRAWMRRIDGGWAGSLVTSSVPVFRALPKLALAMLLSRVPAPVLRAVSPGRLRGRCTDRPVTLCPMPLVFPLRSQRLNVRPFEDDDIKAMHSVYGNSEVMRYVGEGKPASLAQTTALLRLYRQHQHDHGYAFWAVIEVESGMPIGDAGFAVTEHGVELGYTLGRDWWGRGMATEAASLCVETAFGPLGLQRLVGLADVANPASARVLTKLGFRFQRDLMAYGRPHTQFVLTRDSSRVPQHR